MYTNFLLAARQRKVLYTFAQQKMIMRTVYLVDSKKQKITVKKVFYLSLLSQET